MVGSKIVIMSVQGVVIVVVVVDVIDGILHHYHHYNSVVVGVDINKTIN